MARKQRNNRKAGIRKEQERAQQFRELGFTECETTRNTSRKLDAQGVDYVGLPWHVQEKYTQRQPNYIEVLNRMPKDKVRMVIHSRPYEKPTVTMFLEDYLNETFEGS